jgi:membrane protease YdiL (CAAX protease family)
LLAGLVIGGLTIVVLTVASSGSELRTSKLLQAILIALLVAPLEEWLFRGVLQTVLVRCFRPVGGVLMGAVVFALAHFFKVPSEVQPHTETWTSGLTAMGWAWQTLAHHIESEKLWVLCLLGVVLGFMREWTKQLWFSIGMHAAVIVMVKITSMEIVFAHLTLTLLLLVMLAWGLWRYYPKPPV